jgi:hypothetical protein
MARKTVQPRKRRGPPPTGKGEPVQVRLQPPQMAALDAWIARQPEPRSSRPEAIRRLLEDALAATPAKPVARSSKKTAANASEMAGRAIDRLGDQSAPAAEQESRKRRLLKGPKEFRDIRTRLFGRADHRRMPVFFGVRFLIDGDD